MYQSTFLVLIGTVFVLSPLFFDFSTPRVIKFEIFGAIWLIWGLRRFYRKWSRGFE
jgi:hypothetical protein